MSPTNVPPPDDSPLFRPGDPNWPLPKEQLKAPEPKPATTESAADRHPPPLDPGKPTG